MILARKLKLVVYAIVLCCAMAYWYSVHYPSEPKLRHIPIIIPQKPADTSLLKDVKIYCDSLGFSTQLALLVDLFKYSGEYRLFGVNLDTRDTLIKGLVTHGHCKKAEGRMAEFSNDVGCNCSSFGHFRVGGKYQGAFGISYKLIGLDSSNSHALERYVVLHSHSCVPDQAQEDDICQSEGCPTVSPNVLQQLIPYLDASEEPVLLYILE